MVAVNARFGLSLIALTGVVMLGGVLPHPADFRQQRCLSILAACCALRLGSVSPFYC